MNHIYGYIVWGSKIVPVVAMDSEVYCIIDSEEEQKLHLVHQYQPLHTTLEDAQNYKNELGV